MFFQSILTCEIGIDRDQAPLVEQLSAGCSVSANAQTFGFTDGRGAVSMQRPKSRRQSLRDCCPLEATAR